MQLKLEKNKGEYKLNIIKKDNKKEKFEYIKFINMLYEGDKVDKITYGAEITKDEQNQIDEMIKQINEVVK